ncbi:MAG: prepilin-type N-terminal cleavage/methylation domain-containing protein [Sharpea porci]|uniref:prepilin-type N-terminal cleavage/methylation domain-containing protein n=1 Tax=Sharpea porci TaxID=2652286 RepID=UPI00240A4CF8|nr:prepilin-type N-terminal cleavage/methylation domain-containing protein [Sharpea porci]MDD6711599.1 prepilin-type N-terminal cleavage/methylation domain-containing protein [Sharpea porci]
MRVNKNKGFTLIEIIVVIVILAVLMAVAVPSVMSYINEADDAKYTAVARAAFLNARNGFVHEYAEYGLFDKQQYNRLQIYVGKYGAGASDLKNVEEEIGPRKDYGDQVSHLFLCKMKLTPSKEGIASMTVAINFRGSKEYKLVTIEPNGKMTVGKEYYSGISKSNGTLHDTLD